MERRLAAILSADVVGYARLMGEDEIGTLAALKRHRKELIDPKAAQYNGHTIKLMGDGALMEFASVVEAVTFAVEVQLAMRQRNAGQPEDRRILYRIGINIGDILVEDDDIFGDGVNVAARLEGLAEPGGICFSRPVHTQIKGKLDLTFERLGEKEVKNIAEPVTVYGIVLDDKATALVTPVVRDAPKQVRQPWPIATVAGIILLLAIAGALWWQPWAASVNPGPLETTASVIADAPSVAVLPFDNMSGGAELEYFSDGITEDIITELSNNPDIKVIARNSSFTYKDKTVKAQQIGNELGVRYVLEGSVRKQGDKVRITAQLIDTKSDAHVWAERFDEEGTDIFAIQDRITRKIDATLSGHDGRIRETEYQRVWKMDAAKLEEYDYYLRGHSVFFGFTPEAMLKSREIWQEGLQKFPGSGLLRIKIAWGYFQFFYQPWGFEREANLKRADELLQEGLTDKDLPLVGRWYGHWLEAFVQLHLNRDYDRALEEAMKTLAIAPNHSDALADNAQILVYAGNPDLAIEWITRAMSIEPYVPDWYYQNLGFAFFARGDCQEAVRESAKAAWVAVDRNTATATCYVELGQVDDARAELAMLLEEQPDLTASSLDRYLPFQNEAVLERMRTSLTQVGLPE